MNNLNAGQLEAVNSKSKKILCLAGAGTGKTHTMIERISRIASEENPESILALTFTNAAAFEMKERYIKRNPGKRVPEFRTFHGFCYSVICRNSSVRTKLGYSTIPSICTEAQVKQIETRARLELNIKLSSIKLSGKTPVTDPREVFQLNNFKKRVNQIMKTEGTSAILCRTNKEVDAVKDYLTSHLISFRETNSDDMCEKVLRSVKDSEFMIELSAPRNA